MCIWAFTAELPSPYGNFFIVLYTQEKSIEEEKSPLKLRMMLSLAPVHFCRGLQPNMLVFFDIVRRKNSSYNLLCKNNSVFLFLPSMS